jgi:hypothetical protein
VVEPYDIMIMVIFCYCLMSVDMDSYAWFSCLILGRESPWLPSKLSLAMLLWHLLVFQLLIGHALCGEMLDDSPSSPSASGAWSFSLVYLEHMANGLFRSLLLNKQISYDLCLG